MILKVRTSDGKVVARFPRMEDADPETGHTLVDEATISGKSTPGCRVQAGAIVADAALLTEELLAKIDAEREVEAMKLITRGTGKAREYDNKAKEVADYRSLATTLLNTLSLIQKRKRFPFIMAESELRAETMEATVTRWETGMAASLPALAKLAAKTHVAKDAVKAATTVAAKQAAAQINWQA